MDLFFNPLLDAKNIRYFFNLVQPDGYNPCSLRNSRFYVAAAASLAHYFPRYPGLEQLLTGEFKYAQLWQILKIDAERLESVSQEILQIAEEVEDAEFDRGYWSDHWTYLVDLLISYSAIYPDRLSGLFLDRSYTFFDPTHKVRPRAEKYRLTAQGVRQLDAVAAQPDKIALIQSRSLRRYQVRNQNGQGEIVYTTLLAKIITLVTNKLASLDPDGVGIEMEADRPGWCDALNGLPGIFGSSVNETIELKRLVDFTAKALADVAGELTLPTELADFMANLTALLNRPELTAMQFWQLGGALKEAYREQVFMGLAGAEQTLPLTAAQNFFSKVSDYLDNAINKARTPEGITTYFSYQAEQYRELENGRVEVSQFRQQPIALFLEGFVHALRIATPAQARSLYAAVRNSELYDKKLGMYRVNAPLGEQALDLGRIGVFNYGWLENGSIFLHMHYKFVLEMVRAGLVNEFYNEIEQLLVAFRDPKEYGRNPIENSSFLVSSGFTLDPRQHGRGCVARLSGSTVELMHLWTYLFLGPTPFVFEQGRLLFRPEPVLAKSFFSTEPRTVTPFGLEEILPANSVACVVLGATLLVYINDMRQDTFGEAGVRPSRYVLHGRDRSVQTVEGPYLLGVEAEALRDGKFLRVDVVLG